MQATQQRQCFGACEGKRQPSLLPGNSRGRHWDLRPHKNSEIHIDVSLSRQPLVKGERLVRYEVNTVMARTGPAAEATCPELAKGSALQRH